MAHELIQESSSYINFLTEVGKKGTVLNEIVNKVLKMIQSGRIVIQTNSGVTLSTVNLGDGVNNTIFLPDNYDQGRALAEMPRLLTEVLRLTKQITPIELTDIDAGLRKELGIQE